MRAEPPSGSWKLGEIMRCVTSWGTIRPGKCIMLPRSTNKMPFTFQTLKEVDGTNVFTVECRHVLATAREPEWYHLNVTAFCVLQDCNKGRNSEIAPSNLPSFLKNCYFTLRTRCWWVSGTIVQLNHWSKTFYGTLIVAYLIKVYSFYRKRNPLFFIEIRVFCYCSYKSSSKRDRMCFVNVYKGCACIEGR